MGFEPAVLLLVLDEDASEFVGGGYQGGKVVDLCLN